jgi:succinate dehydrogenase cytochrome b subunit
MSEVEQRRPLSPHLQVYRPMLTMMMSIMHRITGAALYAGTLLLVYYLVAAANGPASFATASWLFGSIVGQIVLFGFTWALFNHLLGGIRHAIWDTGYAMDHPAREYLVQATAIGGIALAVIVWAFAYMMR